MLAQLNLIRQIYLLCYNVSLLIVTEFLHTLINLNIEDQRKITKPELCFQAQLQLHSKHT